MPQLGKARPGQATSSGYSLGSQSATLPSKTRVSADSYAPILSRKIRIIVCWLPLSPTRAGPSCATTSEFSPKTPPADPNGLSNKPPSSKPSRGSSLLIQLAHRVQMDSDLLAALHALQRKLHANAAAMPRAVDQPSQPQRQQTEVERGRGRCADSGGAAGRQAVVVDF